MSQRVVLAGNSQAAIEVLELLLEGRPAADVLAVAPHGGANHAWQSSFAEAARKRGVKCIEPPDINAPAVLDQLRDFQATALLSVYYTQLFRAELLHLFAGRIINFHPSLLPRHRGVAPLVWAIVEGDPSAGLTVHHVDSGVDTGAVIAQHKLPIHNDDTGFDLQQKMAQLVRAAAARLLRGMEIDGTLPRGTPQAGEATVHRSRDATLNTLSWDHPAAKVRNIVRALAHPFPCAHINLGHRAVSVNRVTVESDAGFRSDDVPGTLRFDSDGYPHIKCAEGAIRVEQIVADPAVGATDARELLRSELPEGLVLT